MTALIDALTTAAPPAEARRAAAVATTTAKGWHDDPLAAHALRYHDGSGWTEHVTHYGPVPCPGCTRPSI